MGKVLTGLLAMAVVASACTAEAPGQAVPLPDGTSTAPMTSTSTSRTNSAPPINSPQLDLTRYVSRVCDILTLAQLAPFAISTPGKPRDDVAGPICTWNPSDPFAGARVTVSIDSKVGYGWDGVYARKNRWAFFEGAGEINGYPAVHIGGTRIEVTTGTCLTTVGVNRDLVFNAGVNVNDTKSTDYKSPCSVSDKVASLVIDTLKGGR